MRKVPRRVRARKNQQGHFAERQESLLPELEGQQWHVDPRGAIWLKVARALRQLPCPRMVQHRDPARRPMHSRARCELAEVALHRGQSTANGGFALSNVARIIRLISRRLIRRLRVPLGPMTCGPPLPGRLASDFEKITATLLEQTNATADKCDRDRSNVFRTQGL